ncbi:Transporter, major facilitator family protein [Aphelenchoides fujianensis]|nr:Transporter, major facilitator family protein [Aphelenchoides fujianensis]
MRRFGTYRTQIACGVLTTAFTAATPAIVSYLPFWALIFSRFLQGIPLCNLYPVVGSIVGQWAAANERGLFISVLTGYLQLSCIIAMPLSGVLTELVGWPISFYAHAALNASFFILWAIFYRDDPHKHPFISRRELLKIAQGKPDGPLKPPAHVPYAEIFRTRSVIAVYIAVIGNFITFNFANTFFPSYLAAMFKIPTLPAGIIPAVVLIGNFVVKFATGLICDRLTSIDELSKVRWCNSIAFCGAAVGLVVYLSVPPAWPAVSIVFLAVPFVVLGVNAGGFPKSAVLISGQHGPTILAALQVFLCGSFLLGSFVVPAMTPNKSYEEFSNVFRLYIVLLILTNGVFVALSRASPEPWAKAANLQKPSEEKRALSSD